MLRGLLSAVPPPGWQRRPRAHSGCGHAYNAAPRVDWVVPFYFTARGPLPQTRFNCRKKKRLHPLPYNSSSFNSLALSIHNKQHHRSSSITHSHITLANFSFVNLVLIFRCSSSTTNPVYERSVNLLVLVCSLSSHRHSYHSFYLYLSLYRFIINNIFRPS